MSHVNNQILQNEHSHKRRNDRFTFSRNGTNASKMVTTIKTHCARSADALSARSSKTKRWINSVLNFDQSVKEHRSAVIHVDVVTNILGSVVWIRRICSVNIDSLEVRLLSSGQTLIEFLSVVCFEDVRNVSESCLR